MEAADIFGNPSSKHAEGRRALASMNQSLQRIADILGVPKDCLVVIHGGTDGNRRVIETLRKRLNPTKMFCSDTEHSSIADEFAPGQQFPTYDWSGIPSDTAFMALMGANNETGAIYDTAALREKFPEALILNDWVQLCGKADIPFADADFGTISAHKFFGPKCVGLLYIKNPEHFPELSKDSHTKSPLLVAGMAKAFELLSDENTRTLARWTQQIENFLHEHIPDIRIHEAEKPRVPGIINVAFRGIRGSELMTVLSEQEGVCISTGSACTSDILAPPRVIKALERDPDWQYPIRIGLHTMLEDTEITDLCEMLQHYVGELRARNGVYSSVRSTA